NKELLEKGYDSQLIDSDQLKLIDYFEMIIKDNDISEVHYCDPVDYVLNERLNNACKKMNVNKRVYDSPGFLLDEAIIIDEFSNKKSHFMASFYKKQRKRFNILMNEDGTPYGGKWSFDHENRKRLPKNIGIPMLKQFSYDSILYNKMKNRVIDNFPNNPGEMSSFNYPVTRKQAMEAFEDFLHNRLENFGAYEDAIAKDESFLFHGIITPYLNIGLITPKEIIDKTLEFSEEFSVPLNSIEGFLRQIIGWREFIRGIYSVDGSKQRNSNFWNFENVMPSSFYDGSTGIEPLDKTIKKVLNNAYAHHIERLMVLGNFMLLLEIKPSLVYKWFMELFIDSYDWVMVPNIYGMSQFADGGLLATKPYLSGSNYILKMSDYKKGDWCDIWNSLFWKFINSRRDFFKRNPRMNMMVSMYDKKSIDDKKRLNGIADIYETELFG
ncbi:MAG: cryptochrome/photolyase family protein, partial [Candidatus Marinimicrobia bacterium]|nr:cryptochrome/photolyase family protein [Candidatus Neomarinimicrobiota bacterium]